MEMSTGNAYILIIKTFFNTVTHTVCIPAHNIFFKAGENAHRYTQSEF